MSRTCAPALALVALLVAGPSLAEDWGPVELHGFLSQGYLKTNGNDFLLGHSRDGSFDLSDAALGANVQVTDKLRVGLQLLSRDFGAEGNHAVKLDWGYGDYRLRDWLGVRAGKVRLPIGLHNETRDADVLRPMAFLPQGVYDDMTRDFIIAANGGGLYGDVSLGQVGALEYALVAGSVNLDPETTLVKANINAINDSGAALGLPPVSELRWQGSTSFAGRVLYTTPLTGLSLGASLAQTAGSFDLVTSGNVIARLRAEMQDRVVLSAEYARAGLIVAAEYQTFKLRTTLEGYPIDKNDPEAWYLLASWRVPRSRGLSLNGSYDVYRHDKDDAETQGKGITGSRKDLGLGVRWDVTRNFIGKVEWHTVKGAGSFTSMIAELMKPEAPVEDWSYFIAKLSFAF